MQENKKFDLLVQEIKKFKKIAVAFSGGKDSFFLLKKAIDTLGKSQVTAFCVIGNFSSQLDKRRIQYFKKFLDFRLKTIRIELKTEKRIWSNPKNRCYFCKGLIFGHIKKTAKKLGIDTILDGSTYSDLSEFRPGLKAIEELHVISPLKDAGVTSEEIEKYLKSLGINSFYLTSSTCLATRFPYQHRLNEAEIRQFDDIETFLTDHGIFPVRIRYIPGGIRIETIEKHFKTVLYRRTQIVDFCNAREVKFVSLDIGGIKYGSWD